MKTEIKEFIKEQHAEACSKWKVKIEEKFPELFKSEIEEGKWYKHTEGTKMLIYITDIVDGEIGLAYGWSNTGKWWDECVFGFSFLTPATDKEVKDALIAEAKRRGIDNDTNIICAYMNIQGKVKTTPCIAINGKETAFWGKNGAIFHNGKWATIIEEEAKIDFERLLLVVEIAEIREKLNQLEAKL